MTKPKPKKKAKRPQDLTLRNNRARVKEIEKLKERVYVLEKVSDELRDAFCRISKQITPSSDKAKY